MLLLPERFWTKVDKHHPSGCWMWVAGVNAAGYGRFWLDGGQMAHRLAYQAVVGPVPDGLVLDHLCRRPRCVNPSHLEPVTIGENSLRGVGACAANSRKAECVRGHAFSAENTRFTRDGMRVCRTCQRQAQRKYRQTAAAVQIVQEVPSW